MNGASPPDEPAEPGFLSIGAMGAILAFAVTAPALAAIYLVAGGKEEPRGKRQADSYLHAMPSLSSLRETDAPLKEPPLSPAPKTSPAPDPPASAPAGKPLAEVTLPSHPAEQEKPEVSAALPPRKQEKNPGTQGKEGRPWVINVASLQSKTSVQHLADKLKKDGYNAYVMESDQKGKLWYRVRVGFFPSREEAARAAQQISQRVTAFSAPGSPGSLKTESVRPRQVGASPVQVLRDVQSVPVAASFRLSKARPPRGPHLTDPSDLYYGFLIVIERASIL